MQTFRFLRRFKSQQTCKILSNHIKDKRFYSRNFPHFQTFAVSNHSRIIHPYLNANCTSFSTSSAQHSTDENADTKKETSDDENDESFVAAENESYDEEYEDETHDETEINEMEKAQKRILELEKEVKKWKDNLLRSHADIINLQNMNKKDMEKAKKYSNKNFARDMLEVNDALLMALKEIKDKNDVANDNSKAIVDGIELTHRILLNTFSKHGIKKIDAIDEQFDPSKHEALFQIQTDEYPPNMVREVINDGFQIHDQILRSAKVGITNAPMKPAVVNEEDEKSDEEERVINDESEEDLNNDK